MLPKKVSDKNAAALLLERVLSKHVDTDIDSSFLETSILVPRENRYVRIIAGMNASLINRVTQLKEKYYEERIAGSKDTEFPRFHGV